MNSNELEKICTNADMIVNGYAFNKRDDNTIQVLQLRAPYHALILSSEGDVLETSMDDVELDIVKGYWQKNHKYMEEGYAQVL